MLNICDELEGVNFHLFNDEQKLMIAHKRQVFYIWAKVSIFWFGNSHVALCYFFLPADLILYISLPQIWRFWSILFSHVKLSSFLKHANNSSLRWHNEGISSDIKTMRKYEQRFIKVWKCQLCLVGVLDRPFKKKKRQDFSVFFLCGFFTSRKTVWGTGAVMMCTRGENVSRQITNFISILIYNRWHQQPTATPFVLTIIHLNDFCEHTE